MKSLFNSINQYFVPDFKKYGIGVICGEFKEIKEEIFIECKSKCESLWVLVKDSSDDKEITERVRTLYNTQGVDGVLIYSGEDQLLLYLRDLSPDIRFLENKYKGKIYPGFGLNYPVCYLDF
jgi:DNA-binding LacI/PurR family transcriptional regulator